MRKGPGFHRLCQTEERFFLAWEHGCGPGQKCTEEGAVSLARAKAESLQRARPKPPPLAERAWNLAGAVLAFVSDGCRLASKEEYERRLRICDACEQRVDSICAACGCYIPGKVRGRVWKCPLGKWS